MKKLFKKVMVWLRRRVTALKSEEGRVKSEMSCSTSSVKRTASNADTLMLRMEEFVAERYEVRYNRLSQQYELAEQGGSQWMRLDDELCYRLMMEMNHEGIAITKSYLVRAVVQGGGLVQRYHPVCSYLESLPRWDGQGHIEALFRRVTDDEQLLRWLRKWFIGMVAQVMGRMGTYGNSVCPILISRRQGWGKSQFAKMLVPPQLRVFYTDTFNLQQEDACLRRMTAYMLINVDEIDRFRDTRMATFKNMVQLAGVSMKRAYHSQMEEKERMASFIATSNRHYLLHDESGSRRFICVELTHAIDTDTPIDYTQLYAEAMAALEEMAGGKKTIKDLFKNDPNAKREKQDYKKFFSVLGKHVVFYSEKSGFWKKPASWPVWTSSRRSSASATSSRTTIPPTSSWST